MIAIEKERRHILYPLFSYTEETFVKTCLQGHMGAAWADCLENPRCALIAVSDFCLVAGDAACPEAKELVQSIPRLLPRPFLIVAPENGAWGDLIETTHPLAEKHTRYAIHKDKDCFNLENLKGLRDSLPGEYTIKPIDEAIYHQCLTLPFAEDFCSSYEDYPHFKQKGLGFCAFQGDALVGGASCYAYFDGGIEVEVDVEKSHRRKGIAAACAAALILACLERGLYPSWDAANMASVRLSEKLGYRFSHEYEVYFLIQK